MKNIYEKLYLSLGFQNSLKEYAPLNLCLAQKYLKLEEYNEKVEIL